MAITQKSSGFFGKFGGAFAPDTLMPALDEVYQQFCIHSQDPTFIEEYESYLTHYVGRPTPLYYARNLSAYYGVELYLKREDLNHTGAHKINNSLGQALLAKRMGKTRIIAETGAGQHGVATATAAALVGIKCEIYMGAEDIKRQALNVYRMELMGATVNAVTTGSQTLKDATSEAMRDWMQHVNHTHFIVGSAIGPHPFPTIVRQFQSIIGKEAQQQCRDQLGGLPDSVVACVGGGSNAMGMFHHFVPHSTVRLIGVEAAGKGLETTAHAASLSKGIPGILHGSLNRLLQSKTGQIEQAHSVSAGLDYPGVGPELCHLLDQGRIHVEAVTDDEAMKACRFVSQKEGIIPALETAHAFAILENKALFKEKEQVVLCLSGRGDKDMETIRSYE